MPPKVGTIERGNPLPGGQYWVDVFGANIPKADAWFRAFSGLGVHVDAAQSFDSSPVRNWYKFTYTPTLGVPVVWDTSLGFPTVADSSITQSLDTVQRPNPELDITDKLSSWINETEQKLAGSLGSVAAVVPYAILGAAGYAAYLLLGYIAVRKVKRSVKRTSRT